MPTEIVQTKTYVKTFVALMGLLALTVGANLVNLGPFGVVVALGIAIAKAALIIPDFHGGTLQSSDVLAVRGGGVSCGCLFLLVMSMTDYATRDWSGPDWRNATNGVNHVEFSHAAGRRGDNALSCQCSLGSLSRSKRPADRGFADSKAAPIPVYVFYA